MFHKNPPMESLLIEIRILASRIGSLGSVLPHLALLAALGIMIPALKGVDFLDSQLLGAYACLGLIFAGPATAQIFPEGVSASFKQAKARIFAGVLYGEVVTLLLLGAGISTVYLTHRGRFVPEPDWETVARCALFGLAASGMLASLAALVTVRFSRRTAIWCLRLVFFGLLILFYYRGQWLPDVGLTAAISCIAAAGVLIELLRRACR
jgi:hypothetical protein